MLGSTLSCPHAVWPGTSDSASLFPHLQSRVVMIVSNLEVIEGELCVLKSFARSPTPTEQACVAAVGMVISGRSGLCSGP